MKNTCEIFNKNGERAIDTKSIESLTECIFALPQTKTFFVDKNGNYTPERAKLHAEIIKDFKDDVICIDKGKPIAVLMGGSPASGKSTFLKKYRPYLLSDNLFKVDADEIRAKLPEYKGWNATQTHEETGDIVKTLISDRNIGIPCKFDFIYDGTMTSVKKYLSLIELLKSEGYEVFVVFISNIPKDVVRKRALERYQKSGRFVPMMVIDDFYKNGEDTFKQVKEKVDGYVVVDGSTFDYNVIEKGGKSLPNDRLYEKLGHKIELKYGGQMRTYKIMYKGNIRLETAMSEAEAIAQAQEKLKMIHGHVPASQLIVVELDKPSEKFAEGGLIAPNGKPSKLNHEQWLLVRTPEFKTWFGDWENSPESASQVVDENGEPLVVWRGESKDFNVFDYKKLGSKLKTAWRKAGFFFAPTKRSAEQYEFFMGSGILKQFFLNIKNPYTLSSEEFYGTMDWGSLPTQKFKSNNLATAFANNKIAEIKSENFDGVFVTVLKENNVVEIIAFNPNQIKLADGTNTTFDGNNSDIRFEKGGSIENTNDPQFIQYNGDEIMFVPVYGTYWVNDEEFETLEQAKSYIDEGYEPKMFAKGGQTESKVIKHFKASDFYKLGGSIEEMTAVERFFSQLDYSQLPTGFAEYVKTEILTDPTLEFVSESDPIFVEIKNKVNSMMISSTSANFSAMDSEMNKKIRDVLAKNNIKSKEDFIKVIRATLSDSNFHTEAMAFVKDLDSTITTDKEAYRSEWWETNSKINDVASEISILSDYDGIVLKNGFVFALKMNGYNSVADSLEKAFVMLSVDNANENTETQEAIDLLLELAEDQEGAEKAETLEAVELLKELLV